jgi:DnaJ-class molecular chaperone
MGKSAEPCGDSEFDSEDEHFELAGTIAGCPDCSGSGSILLLRSHRPCQRCSGMGFLMVSRSFLRCTSRSTMQDS